MSSTLMFLSILSCQSRNCGPNFKDLPYFAKYFPDFTDKQLPEREYFFNVIATLFPGETKELISEARNRRSSQSEENKEELVEIDPELKKHVLSLLTHPSNFEQ
jgi:mevalonate kinase